MKCIYYSIYPYEDPEFEVIDDPRPGYEASDGYKQPFRVYKAAACTTDTEYASIEDFLNEIYEILDMPEYKGIEDRHKPFTIDDIHVEPTKHLYGATNSIDGIYEMNGKFYVQYFDTDYELVYAQFTVWKEAIDYLYKHYPHRGSYYEGGIDYNKPE